MSPMDQLALIDSYNYGKLVARINECNDRDALEDLWHSLAFAWQPAMLPEIKRRIAQIAKGGLENERE